MRVFDFYIIDNVHGVLRRGKRADNYLGKSIGKAIFVSIHNGHLFDLLPIYRSGRDFLPDIFGLLVDDTSVVLRVHFFLIDGYSAHGMDHYVRNISNEVNVTNTYKHVYYVLLVAIGLSAQYLLLEPYRCFYLIFF